MTGLRTDRHQHLSALLASHSDSELAELIDTGRSDSVGVGGGSAVLDVDGVPVFAKRIPLTDRELTRRASTANLFDLPLYCQYGMGGPSFNAWRELAANNIVTDAVLAAETQSFPMLYHWRVLPGRPAIAAEHADIDTVVAAQGGSPGVRARLEALASAPCSLVLFCELPHMDGHFGNMRSDGERVYLADFGLATSPHFHLSTAERDFVERHATYDANYAAMRLVNWLVSDVCGIPVPAGGGPVARNEYVRQCAAGRIPHDVPPAVPTILTRHAPAAAMMNAFSWKLFDGEIHTDYAQLAEQIDLTI